MNKLKIWLLNTFTKVDLCPKCETKCKAEGYEYLVCPNCKEVIYCVNGNRASEGRDDG
jgi:tRNA(Ile2) C34 agmatinyltransferase TiaS